MRELKGHVGFVLEVAFTPDGSHLLSASSDYTARLWDLAGGTSRKLPGKRRSWVAAVACSPDGRRVAVGDHDGKVSLLNLAGRKRLPPPLSVGNEVSSLAFSPDGALLACGRYGSSVELVEVAPWEKKGTLRGLGTVFAVRFSPDGSLLAVGHSGGSVKLFDPARRALRHELKHGDRAGCRSLAFSPDGKYLFAALGRGVLRWDLGGLPNPPAVALAGHTAVVSAVSLSPDGRALLSGSWDGTVRLWDAASGEQRGAFNWNLGKVFDVAFAPDGMTAAVAGHRSTIVVWDVEAPD